MSGTEFFDFPFWWICPLLMIALCYFMMRGRRCSTKYGFGSRGTESDFIKTIDSAADILDKRYALGEMKKEEY